MQAIKVSRYLDAGQMPESSLTMLFVLHDALVARKPLAPSPADWCEAWFRSHVEHHDAPPQWPTAADDAALDLKRGTLGRGARALVKSGRAWQEANGHFIVALEPDTIH